MPPALKKLPAAFYRSATGAEPVRDWLKDQSVEDRTILGRDIATAEFAWPVGMPLCRSLGDGLWEIRSSLTQGRIARVIFCVAAERMVLLHAFVKKTQRTPKPDLDLAKTRKRDLQP